MHIIGLRDEGLFWSDGVEFFNYERESTNDSSLRFS